jgi:peptide/nickel transport system permease protein
MSSEIGRAPGGVASGLGAAMEVASAGSAPRRALARLARDRVALAFAIVLVLVVAACLAAPLWARVAGTGPLENHITDRIELDGVERDVVSVDGVPIGPTWGTQFFLGADANGRDTAVRLLYGGRNSLMIGFGAAALMAGAGLVLGLLAGYLRGWVDAVISRLLDILWSFPVVVLGIALGVALALGGLSVGPLHLAGDSLAIPVIILALIGLPYLARPIRGQVLALRERPFVEAARAEGAGPLRIMLVELLPNLLGTLLVFFPITVANAILLESGLSFLGAGVQPPAPSWGSMIAEGLQLMTSAPHLVLVPGLMLAAVALALNVLGDLARDALDPKGGRRR